MEKSIMAVRASSTFCCLQWLLLILLLLTQFVSSSPIERIPRLGVLSRIEDAAASLPDDYLASQELQTYYYNQTLDHFNFQPQSYATFQQKYVISFKHWTGAQASAPIFAYLGEESPLNADIHGIGFLFDNAAKFGALTVFIEHRFYGDSIPFVSRQEALANATLRGYFNSAQALADYAEILLNIKLILSAETSPIIVIGGSYGGMLASWFRLKYPHIALGALASSAPILYFDNITPSDAYYSLVTKDYRDASESCSNTIKESWLELARVASQENGLSILSEKFHTCIPLQRAGDLESYLMQIFSVAAQYDRPPRNPLYQICKGIDNAPEGSDILDRIFSGLASFYPAQRPCYNVSEFFAPETMEGWSWQVCSELVVPMGGGNDTIIPEAPFDLKKMSDFCLSNYGVLPRPHWVTTYYGGHLSYGMHGYLIAVAHDLPPNYIDRGTLRKIKETPVSGFYLRHFVLNVKLQHTHEVLKKFGSNIIFSNGLRDPYSSGGVLQDISDSIVALNTVQGTHCMDILPAREDDPEWLVMQREREIEIISGWILKYYQDLLQSHY